MKINEYVTYIPDANSLKYRLAIRIAADITDSLHYQCGYGTDQAQLLMDLLTDALVQRTDDELLGLVRTGSGGIYG